MASTASGKLSAFLRGAARAGARPIGFARPERKSAPSLPILIQVTSNTAGVLSTLNPPADCVLVDAPLTTPDPRVAAPCLGILWNEPAETGQSEPAAPPSWASFAIATPATLPARWLTNAAVESFIALPPDLSPFTVRALASLGARGLIVDIAAAEDRPYLTVESLANVRLACESTKGFVLVRIGNGLQPDDLTAVCRAGASGVILPAPLLGTDAESVARNWSAWRAAAVAAGAPEEREAGPLPLVPSITPTAVEEEDEEE